MSRKWSKCSRGSGPRLTPLKKKTHASILCERDATRCVLWKTEQSSIHESHGKKKKRFASSFEVIEYMEWRIEKHNLIRSSHILLYSAIPKFHFLLNNHDRYNVWHSVQTARGLRQHWNWLSQPTWDKMDSKHP